MTLCNRNTIAAVILDLSGNDDWLGNEYFEQAFLALGQQHAIVYIGDQELAWTKDAIVYQGEVDETIPGLLVALRQTDWDYSEFETIVLTNNTARISEWHALNHSVVYLQVEGKIPFEHNHMPDEIWRISVLEHFVQTGNTVKPFRMECVGIENGVNVSGINVKFMMENTITNIQFPVIFAGRYFKEADPRHYIHPLSRAIIQFKHVVNDQYGPSGARLAILRVLAKVVEDFIEKEGDVSLVTAVPSRPNKQHRFYGFNQFYQNTTIPLDFNVLETIRNYESPKYYRSYEEKYRCVQNAFQATGRVQGHVVLLDDVYTTGVTASECVRVILAAGADKVTVIPLAHTQANSAELYTLNGEFDNYGHEYKMVFNRTNGKALWKRDDIPGFTEHGDVVTRYLAQNRISYYNLSEPRRLPQLEEIQAIIFDLDNTLVQTDGLEDYRYQSGSPDYDTICQLSHLMVSPNDVELLCESGVKIGVVTRSRRAYAEAVLEAYDYPYDVLISRYDCERTKPYGDPFISCARRLRVAPENVLAIGNESTDTNASVSAAMHTVEIGRTHTIEDVQQLLQEIIGAHLPF